MKIEFRKARAKDVDAAIPLIYSAGPHVLDYIFTGSGSTAHDFLRYAFTRGGGFLGHRIHMVAEAEGAVVGIAAFYSGREHTRLDLEAGLLIFKHYGPLRCWPVMRRGLRATKAAPPPEKDTEFVADFSVDPNCRGQGIGEALLRKGLNGAREKGKKKYALDVADFNTPAKKLYERFGFLEAGKSTLVVDKQGTRFTFVRMEMEI
ncbi:MAG: GNAT family N-acetyltransferase [bacterium]|nr:GNAT family N-acetyltransferase [bacterium]